MEFLYEYGLFVFKLLTVGIIVIAVVAAVFAIALRGSHGRGGEKGTLEITRLNDQYEDMCEAVMLAIVPDSAQKALEKKLQKEKKKRLKSEKKGAHVAKDEDADLRHVYVINFDGDMNASAVDHLREEITAILSQATSPDEVVLRLESSGGIVHGYGFAASQLDRLRKKGVSLTVCVDKVAASGGYMMACVADKILAAPFAILGSVGVIAQLPNFNRLLKKHDVDFELLTAGEYKRTLTLFGENTESGREKFIEQLEEIHTLFKEYVAQRRPQVDIDRVATGETWYGRRALDVALVDELQTSDEYLVDCIASAEVFEVNYVMKKSLAERLGVAVGVGVDGLLIKWWTRLNGNVHKF